MADVGFPDLSQLESRLAAMEQSAADKQMQDQFSGFLGNPELGGQFGGNEKIGAAILSKLANVDGIDFGAITSEVVSGCLDQMRSELKEMSSALGMKIDDIQKAVDEAVANDGAAGADDGAAPPVDPNAMGGGMPPPDATGMGAPPPDAGAPPPPPPDAGAPPPDAGAPPPPDAGAPPPPDAGGMLPPGGQPPIDPNMLLSDARMKKIRSLVAARKAPPPAAPAAPQQKMWKPSSNMLSALQGAH